MRGLNLAGFEKIKEDKNTVHMKHKDGHVIILAANALPKIQREQLKRLKLADGGALHEKGCKCEGCRQNFADGAAPVSPTDQLANNPIDLQVPQTEQNTPLLNSDQTLNVPATVGLGQQAIREQQAVDQAKGVATANMEKGYIDTKARQAQVDQDNLNDIKKHTDDFNAFIQANPPNPKHYQESMGTGQKVASAIGLLFGGFGQGASGGSNPAMDYLNHQIDRDIDAQQKRSDQQKTVFGAYQSLYGDQNIASNLAKATQLDIYTHQAQMLAAKTGTAQAQSVANALTAKWGAEKDQLLKEASARRGTINTGLTQQAPAQQAPSQASQPPQKATQEPESEGVFSQFVHGRLGSTPKANAMPMPEEEQKQPIYKILSPDADKILHGSVQYGSEESKQDYPSVLDQFTKAQQAEKVLNGPNGDGVGGIHDLMQQMYANSGSGSAVMGLGSHLRNTATGALGAIPEVGTALVGASRVIPRTEAQKAYDSNRSVMETDLANALQGLVAPTDIKSIVEANLPAYMDTPKDIEEKTKKIVNMVIKAAKTSQLQQYKMTK